MHLIIGDDDKEYGPATAEQIRAWLMARRIGLDNKAKAEGTDTWKLLGEFPEFAGFDRHETGVGVLPRTPTTYIIIGTDQKEHGPVTAQQIRAWFAERSVTCDNLAKVVGTDTWRRLRDFPDFVDLNLGAPDVKAGDSPPEPRTPQVIRKSSEVTVGPQLRPQTKVRSWLIALAVLIPIIGVPIILIRKGFLLSRNARIGWFVWLLFSIAPLVNHLGSESPTVATGDSRSISNSQPEVLSKEEWLKKASALSQETPTLRAMVAGGILMVQKDKLYAAVGAPTSTQMLETDAYLYWDCSDGQIQVVTNRLMLNNGMIYGGKINSF
jgi:hypothetical protein